MMSELVVNLWAIYDADVGYIYALLGKAYRVAGDDDAKLRLLKSLSSTDHLTAKRYEVPSRFQITYGDGTVVKSVTQLNAIADPNASLFEEMFANLEADLPPLMSVRDGEFVGDKQRLPSDPLCVVTVLYEDDQGVITPIVTDADRAWIREQERLRGR
jgi:hypothetical protein